MTPIGDKLASTIITQLEVNDDFDSLSDAQKLQYLNLGQQILNNLVNSAGLNDYSTNNLTVPLVPLENGALTTVVPVVLDANGIATITDSHITTAGRIILNPPFGLGGMPIRVTSVVSGETATIASGDGGNDFGLNVSCIIFS